MKFFCIATTVFFLATSLVVASTQALPESRPELKFLGNRWYPEADSFFGVGTVQKTSYRLSLAGQATNPSYNRFFLGCGSCGSIKVGLGLSHFWVGLISNSPTWMMDGFEQKMNPAISCYGILVVFPTTPQGR